MVLHHPKPLTVRAVRAKTLDGCLLLAEIQGKLVGVAGIDLDRRTLSELVLHNAPRPAGLADALLGRAEDLALAFGLLDLGVAVTTGNASWFMSRAYRPTDEPTRTAASRNGKLLQVLVRSLRRRQTIYTRQLRKIGEELGIPGNYGQFHRLQIQQVASTLRSIGLDVFGREQWMSPRAAAAWQRMCLLASASSIELQAVSAWRSVSYQQGLVQRKLEKGLAIDAVLRVSAAPGYSEHHTGRAIDITSPGCDALSEDFAQSPAFKWLKRHAPGFGFQLSFPLGNRHQLAYEPWHWCFHN